jgi:neutral ceramidase
MSRICIVWFVFAWVGPFAAAAAPQAPAPWRVGTATRVITPKVNLWMGGYAARTHPAVGTTQDLQAKALALSDADGGRFVFVTLDAIASTRVVRQAVEARLAQLHQLKTNEFVITASHTHSGPEFRAGRVPEDSPGAEEAAHDYLVMLQNTVVEIVGEALGAMQPATVSYAHARAGFAMNRRLPAGGGFTNAPNPEGPVDPDVPVLRVDGPDGKLRAVLFGYACHNTTLTQTNYNYCADYAGFAQQYLQEAHPGVTALFMTGCGGDQNPYPRSTLVLAQTHGRTLATAVEAALGTKPRPLTGPLRAEYAETQLRYAGVPTRAEYQERLKAKDATVATHARRMLARWDKEGRLPETYPYPVQVVHFGPGLRLVALGGEAVVDYSLRLKRELAGTAAVWVSAYSNDVMGYIPTERVLREGGYEGLEASRIGSLHPSPWASGLEDQIVSRVHELDRALNAATAPAGKQAVK